MIKVRKGTIVLLLISLLITSKGITQIKEENFQINVKKINATISIDGSLSEDAWQQADSVYGFYRNYPDNNGYAQADTKVKLLYDDEFLYVGAIMENSEDFKEYTISTLKRDQFDLNDDCFSILIDTYNDQVNCIGFKITPLGSQSEFLGSEGGKNWDVSWDNKWYSETLKNEEFWTVEMKIPFSSLRFNKNNKQWRVLFWRNNISENEISSWVPVSKNFKVYEDFTQFGQLNFENNIEAKYRRFNIIPSITVGANEDFEDVSKGVDYSFTPSLDAKLAVTSSLALDLTINPDFSQTEVDEQQANISQFELSYPEKRQFFIENSDLFAGFGIATTLFGEIRPFFSRRIGLAYNPESGLYENIPIIAGARLSGKVNNKLRIGIMSAQTNKKDNFYTDDQTGDQINLNSQNYSAVALQYKVFSNSNISGLFVNKESAKSSTEYNRTATLQYNWTTKDNKWSSKWIASQTFFQNAGTENGFYGTQYTYNSKKLYLRGNALYIGEDYNPEVGFVTRKGLFFDFWPEYNIYVKDDNSQINNWTLSAGIFTNLETDFNPLDRLIWSGIAAKFKSTALFWIGVRHDYRELRFDFDPSFEGGENLLKGEEFSYRWYYLYWNSDTRKKFSVSNELDYGEHYNGIKFSMIGNVNYRIQPKGIISLKYTYHKILLPYPYSDNEILIIGPGVNWAFSKSIFFSFLTQYNNLIDNVNFNARFQWRFAPVSDFYIIYTDNYDSQNFDKKNRAIMVKFSYWI